MDYSNNFVLDDSGYSDGFAADAAVEARMAFIRRTYAHLFGALLVFMGLCYIFMTVAPIRNGLMQFLAANWIITLVLFLGAQLLGQWLAHSNLSSHIQYLGLGIYTVAMAVFTTPLLLVAQMFGGPDIIPTAAILTALIFTGLTVFVFVTKKDFSFLGMGLMIATLGMLGFAILGGIMGFSMGIGFAVLGVIVFSGWILYDTSNVLHHYRTDQHVGAALELFASVVILFRHLVYLLMILSGDD